MKKFLSDNYTMLCDFYELTMGSGYFQSKNANKILYFDLYFRAVPDGGGFAITAGLDQVIDYIENLHFDEDDIAYLRSKGKFPEEFLSYLANFKFTGDIYAVPEGTPFRFELGFLPIAYIAYTLGPLYAGLGYLTADVIGSLFSGYAPNPWISLCQLAAGVIMGIFFYKRKFSFSGTVICFSVIAVLVEFLLKSPIFVFMYDWTWGFTLGTRAINAAINLVIRVCVYFAFTKLLEKQLDELRKKL